MSFASRMLAAFARATDAERSEALAVLGAVYPAQPKARSAASERQQRWRDKRRNEASTVTPTVTPTVGSTVTDDVDLSSVISDSSVLGSSSVSSLSSSEIQEKVTDAGAREAKRKRAWIEARWRPSAETLSRFRSEGYDAEACVEEFVNYWINRGDQRAKMISWEATFVNRMLDLIKHGKAPRVSGVRVARELPPGRDMLEDAAAALSGTEPLFARDGAR